MAKNSTPTLLHRFLLVLVLGLGPAIVPAAAATPAESLSTARQRARELLIDLDRGRISLEEARLLGGGEPPGFTDAADDEVEESLEATLPRLLGTWVVHVPEGGGAPAFDALHTFDASGTFVETSSLLATLTEGPAHGVWRRQGHRKALLTFELFAFEDGEAVGRIRVRARLTVNRDRLDGITTVDVITPDGEVIPDVGSGPFSATRVPVLAP